MYYIRQTLLSYECVHHTEGLGTTDLEHGYKAFTLWLEQNILVMVEDLCTQSAAALSPSSHCTICKVLFQGSFSVLVSRGGPMEGGVWGQGYYHTPHYPGSQVSLQVVQRRPPVS